MHLQQVHQAVLEFLFSLLIEVHMDHFSHLQLFTTLQQQLGLALDILLEEVASQALPVRAINAFLHLLQPAI